jgi:phospholipid transport system transporter-binding protein
VRSEPREAQFALESADAGHWRLEGELTFATARRACAAGLERLRAGGQEPLSIDCGGVTQADSAGLAVLLEWLGAARRAGRTLRLEAVPAGLQALARISEVESLLDETPAPAA